MASFSIHLAIGKRYLEKNKIENEKDFLLGVIDPDLAQDKRKSHYTGSTDTTNLEYFLSEKVLLNRYLETNNIDNDYDLGIFLHLVTDYIFFNHFFDKEYINNTKYHDFNNDLYHSYDNTDNYVYDKYSINYPNLNEIIINCISKARKNKNTNYNNGKDIIPIDKLDNFIEYISNIDLYKYKNKIIQYNKNILPD